MLAHAALAVAGLSSLVAAQGRDVPPSLSSEIIAIVPTAATQGLSSYFETNMAAETTFLNEFSSLVVNNPTYFPSLASDFGVEGGAQATPTPTSGSGSGSGSDSGLPASLSSEIIAIYPTETTESYGAYFSDHPGQYSTFVLELSSIVVNNPTYFPSLASELRAGGAGSGSGATTTQIFRSSEMSSGGTATNSAITVEPHFGPTGNSNGNAQTTTSSSSSSGTGNLGIAQPTPMLGLGLSGAAVAGIAGLAALL